MNFFPTRPLLTTPPRFIRDAFRLVSLLALTTTSSLAVATLSQQIDPPEVSLGDQVTVTFTVQNGGSVNIQLPPVEGLQVIGNNSSTNITFTNGSFSSAISQAFVVVPARTGDFTIPAFDIHTQDGQTLHTQPIKLHVTDNGGGSAPSNPSSAPAPNPATIPGGPVTIPPGGSPPPATNSTASTDGNGNNINVPLDANGQPARVFMVIMPKTTDAYVGETIPMRIEFYIRMDVIAQQDSLPTIKGSDFLINNLSVRPREDDVSLMDAPYHRETWVTAISAPKNGDFPLQMERDTYWTKPTQNRFSDPFGNLFFNRPSLVHGSIPSNQLTIHVRPLPEEGRPANFSGAIGQLKVAANAAPDSVDVGEPVTLHFIVSGEGNFDYVKCPNLAPDPAWKSYVPSSKIDYHDESHTQGVKTFEQAFIPQKNGNLPLPAASFSYFDPTTKQYVTVPVSLPSINVTGSLPAAATASGNPANPDSSTTVQAAPPTSNLLPNRVEIGTPQSSLVPVYHQPWFWAIQGGLIFCLILGALFTCFRSPQHSDDFQTERASRLHTMHQEEDAMSEAVRRGDAGAFFLAARHAVQLKLGTQWRLKPEAITLSEIRHRDPQLAIALEPLFQQADEVIYSGVASSGLDLAQWDQRVRQEFLQLQSS